MKYAVAFVFLTGCAMDPETLISCGDHCRVFAESLVGEDVRHYLAKCSPGFLCAPDRDIALGGHQQLPCTSILDLEGRCLAKCLPAVAPVAILLEKDVCWPGEVCVPCKNPFTNEDTGACTLSGDHPIKK